MSKTLKLLTVLCSFAAVALLVYIAGELALSGSPLLALMPVTIILLIIVLYIRHHDQ